MTKQDKPCCVERGADDLPLDTEGLCQMCFLARGFKQMVDRMRQRERQDDLHTEPVTGQRLAAVIADAAARMAPAERLLLWEECYLLFKDTIDNDTHPELCAVINALPDPVPDDTQAAKWN